MIRMEIVALKLQGPGIHDSVFAQLYGHAVQMLRADQRYKQVGQAGRYEGGLNNLRRYSALGTFGGWRFEATIDQEGRGTSKIEFIAEDRGDLVDAVYFVSSRGSDGRWRNTDVTADVTGVTNQN